MDETSRDPSTDQGQTTLNNGQHHDHRTVGTVSNRQTIAGPDQYDPDCPGYEPGEVRQSRTPQGHLGIDVAQVSDPESDRILISINDFGVGEATVKSSTKNESLFQSWLRRFELAPDQYSLEIAGYTDCVGSPVVNANLRRQRAAAVQSLVDVESSIVSSHEYLTDALQTPLDNTTVEGRAINRAVLIQVISKRDDDRESNDAITFEDSPITGGPDAHIEYARSVWRQFATRSDEDWTFYGSLTMLTSPSTDSIYVDGILWQTRGGRVAVNRPRELRSDVLEAIDLPAPAGRDPVGHALQSFKNYQALRRLDRRIQQGIAFANTAWGGGLSQENEDILRFLIEKMDDPKSIYYPWRNAYPGRTEIRGRLTIHLD